MSNSKVAVVTGANKGIGNAIVKKLACEFDGFIYLTARDETRGLTSLKNAKTEMGDSGRNILFHQLDVADKNSVLRFRDFLKKEHGGLDILINNAGVLDKEPKTAEAFAKDAQYVVGVNYFGTKQTCDILFPVLNAHARVVNVASDSGFITNYREELKKQLMSPDLTTDQLDVIVNRYVELTRSGRHTEEGYPDATEYDTLYVGPHYQFSKAAEIALTFIQARAFEKDLREDLVVNVCCPGYVDTDMTSHRGSKLPEEGADTPVYLALLPENCQRPKGDFVKERTITSWV